MNSVATAMDSFLEEVRALSADDLRLLDRAESLARNKEIEWKGTNLKARGPRSYARSAAESVLTEEEHALAKSRLWAIQRTWKDVTYWGAREACKEAKDTSGECVTKG